MDAKTLKLHAGNGELVPLLSEAQAIDVLGLHDRPSPSGALRWLIRTKKLPCVKLGRGILRFKSEDVAEFVEARYQVKK